MPISTSQLPKVLRRMVCFVHFDFKTCCSPQRRAAFRQLPTCSENGLLCAFLDLKMRFAPQRRAIFHFSSGKPALANLLFDRADPEIIGKTQCCATFLTLAHLYLISSLSLFYSSLVCSSSLPSSLHIVASLTSKVPLIIYVYMHLNFIDMVINIYICIHVFIYA